MTWEQLRQMSVENQKIAEEEKGKPITECPECSWSALRENKNKELLCPICGWSTRR